MKILLAVNHELTLYNFRQEFIKELIDLGHEVLISMPRGKYDELFESFGCRIIETNISQHGMNPVQEYQLFCQYLKIIKTNDPDFIYTYTIKPNIYAGLAASKLKVPYAATITGLGATFEKGSLVSAIALIFYRIAFMKAKCVFFQNSSHEELFSKNKIALGKHCIVNGSGVNLEKNCFEEYPTSKGFRFLFVGRVTKDKGVFELIKAFRMIKQEEENAEVSLELLGNVECDCIDIVNQSMTDGLLVSYGMHNNVHDYIKKSHAVVLPSYHEGMANSLLEAAATGRPILASYIPGCKEAIDDGVSGICFESKSVDALKKALEEFIRLPWEARATMGKNGRVKMENEFDRKTINEKYLQILKDHLEF